MTEMPAVAVLADVMTRSVHVVAPFTNMKTVARLISDNEVGALPVVDDRGAVIGVVSEADLVARVAGRLEQPNGTTAADVMTAPPITAPPDLPVRQAARLMQDCRIRHLPVVDTSGLLRGIVSRGDLLRLYLRGDRELGERIERDLFPRLEWIDRRAIACAVDQGVVTLSGRVGKRSDADVLTRLVARVDGVVGVDAGGLIWHIDDAARRPY
jgi:CBS domain-containing protein